MGEYTKLKIDGEKLKLRTDSLEESKYFSDNIYSALEKYIYKENHWCSRIDSEKKTSLKVLAVEILATLGFTALLGIPAIIGTIFGLYKSFPAVYVVLCLIGLSPLKEGISEIVKEISIEKDEKQRQKIFEENKEKIEKVLEKHKQKLQEQTISKEKEEESNAATDTKVTTEVEHNEELVDAYIESMENTSTSNDISRQYTK